MPAGKSGDLSEIAPNGQLTMHMPAGYAFILVDGGASLFIALDGFYTAGTFAGAFFMGDGIVRTDSFASSAMDTFVLVDEGFSVYHGNGAFGAGE